MRLASRSPPSSRADARAGAISKTVRFPALRAGQHTLNERRYDVARLALDRLVEQ